VLEGRAVAAGTVAKLHAETTFRADLAAAEAEVAALRRGGEAPNADCDAEAAAMSVRIDGVL
jgi:acid phosphatase (class A)